MLTKDRTLLDRLPFFPHARISEAPMAKVLVIRRKRTVKVHRASERPVTIAKRGMDITVRKTRD